MKKPYTSFVTGLLVGVALFSGTTAYAAGIMAERSTNRIFVDGKEVQVEAYTIHNNNFMRSVSMFIGTATMAVCRWKAESPTPEPHPSRLPQHPQTVPGMFPRWVM